MGIDPGGGLFFLGALPFSYTMTTFFSPVTSFLLTICSQFFSTLYVRLRFRNGSRGSLKTDSFNLFFINLLTPFIGVSTPTLRKYTEKEKGEIRTGLERTLVTSVCEVLKMSANSKMQLDPFVG